MSQSSTPVSDASKTPLLSSNTYNYLKHIASIGLPLAAALYYALGQIWHFPDVGQVMVSIASVNTILGGVLGYSTATYNASEAKYAGVIEVAETDLKKVFSLNLNNLPEELEKLTEATFKVVTTVAPPEVTSPSGSEQTSTGNTAHGASF
jgi:hypothetical protein